MKRYLLDREYPRVLEHFGVDLGSALRKAGVPGDTFAHEVPSMSAHDYFAFMEAVGELSPCEDNAVRMSTVAGIEQFSPALFASYCAHDGRACIDRLARYKRLIGPMVFIVTESGGAVSVEMTCEEVEERMPSFLVQAEFAFLVNLIRTATGQQISPSSAKMQRPPEYAGFQEFLGCGVEEAPLNALTFAASDLTIPFVSRNDGMWSFFEPELQRRLSELETDDTVAARVRSALVEMLPAGMSGIDEVARRLGMSKRSLQRKLSDEDTSFQKQLNHTRELLAKHYLGTTTMGTDQIAYLLGYLELNSFLRAFSAWTGMSPSKYRQQNRSTK